MARWSSAMYDAASLVWSKRPWLLAAADPAAMLDRRIAWGGYDETPFITIAELLSSAASARDPEL
jgi:hypothetical protein